MVLRVDAPIKVFGDIHGQYQDLMRFFDLWGIPNDFGDIESYDDNEDSSPAIIQDLMGRGAKQTLGMDKTGETPLHLAARFARAEVAKKLLDNGDDAVANAQDFTGRTPLHSAVAAFRAAPLNNF